MARKVEHEITLVALSHNEDGTRSIVDIVETSNHFAGKFIRTWTRDPMISAVATMRPGPIAGAEWHERSLVGAAS